MGLRAWGSYERWARLVCHAIAWCGLEDPGATLEGLRVFADSATSILASLIAGLQQLDPDAKGCSARNILLAGQSGSNPALAAFLDEIGNPTNAEGVGRRLRQYRGRIVNGCAVGCRKLTGTTLWFVKKG
jgi:hypothetical protein